MSKNKTESKPEKHEYHSISDNEENGDELDAFSKPLDLGPSLLDEVFKELDHPGGDHNIGMKLALKKVPPLGKYWMKCSPILCNFTKKNLLQLTKKMNCLLLLFNEKFNEIMQ